MTDILVDTSAYSAGAKGHQRARAVMEHAATIFFNPAVLGELQAGFLRGSRRAENEETLRSFLAAPRVRVLDITAETARRYAVILSQLRDAGTPLPVNDVWIAASAMEHGLTLLTTDAHFLRVRQILVEFAPP